MVKNVEIVVLKLVVHIKTSMFQRNKKATFSLKYSYLTVIKLMNNCYQWTV